MLAAEIASTTAKPRLILPRNRKVGSFEKTDFSLKRFKNLTTAPLP